MMIMNSSSKSAKGKLSCTPKSKFIYLDIFA